MTRLGGILSRLLSSFLLLVFLDAPDQVSLLEAVIFFHTKGVKDVLKLFD